MQLLLVQFTDPTQPEVLPRFCPQLGAMASMLEEDGHSLSMVACGGFDAAKLHDAIIEHRPGRILVELHPTTRTAGRRTIVDIAENYKLPVVALGPDVTTRPRRSLSQPGVEAVFVGEYEVTALEYFRALSQGQDPAGLPGVWMRDANGVSKGAVRPPVSNLDTLPAPDRDLFDMRRIVERTGEIPFEAARGCGHWCGHCLNDWYLDLYEDQGQTVRRRDPAAVVEALAGLEQEYESARSFRLGGHAVATDEDWLAELGGAYPGKVDRPWTCYVPLADVTARSAELLARAGCRRVDTHIGSGSRFIREDVFGMRLTDRQIVRHVELLKDAGLRVVGRTFVGSPYESEITLEKGVELAGKADFDELHAEVFFPIPGTRSEETCREMGWLAGENEQAYWQHRSVLHMPGLSAHQIERTAERFNALSRRGDVRRLRKILAKAR
jgi:radical SAM superfamily enzyme YgiQ (UPF0313 family)